MCCKNDSSVILFLYSGQLIISYSKFVSHLTDFWTQTIEQCILDTNAGKQQFYAATDVYFTLVLKKWTTFKYRLECWPQGVSK
jgi:hypothetical protein